MHQPTTAHWVAIKHLLCYLKGTISHGLFLRKNSPLHLHAFFDSNWAGNKDDRTSTIAYIVFFDHNPISWASKQ